MSKLYIYRGQNNQATIYYSKEFPESKGVPIFEYDGEIPNGTGVLKTDGATLYWDELIPEPKLTLPESEPTAEEKLNAIVGGMSNE